jgi:hypothetical protein
LKKPWKRVKCINKYKNKKNWSKERKKEKIRELNARRE